MAYTGELHLNGVLLFKLHVDFTSWRVCKREGKSVISVVKWTKGLKNAFYASENGFLICSYLEVHISLNVLKT